MLEHPAAARWMRVLPTPPSLRRHSEAGGNSSHSGAVAALRGPSLNGSCASLMDTIVVPKDLRHLPRVLPPPSYDSDLDAVPDQQPAAAAAAQPRQPAQAPVAAPTAPQQQPARSPSPQQPRVGSAPPALQQPMQQQEPAAAAAAGLAPQAKAVQPAQRPMQQRRASPVPLAYFPPSSPQRMRPSQSVSGVPPAQLRPASPVQQPVLPRLSSPGLMNGVPLLANRPPLPRLSEPGNLPVAAAVRAMPPIAAHPRPRSAVMEQRPRPASALPPMRASADQVPIGGAAALAAAPPALAPPLVRPPQRRASIY